MPKLQHLPPENRPREKLLTKGADALSDVDLLAIMLGSGIPGKNARQVARQIINKLGERLPKASISELRKFPGVGLAKAMQIKSALTLASRMHTAHTAEPSQGVLFPLPHINGKVQPLTRPATPPPRDGFFQLHNRRYLGNKHKLLGFIEDIVSDKCGNFQSFCDLFAGTGVVGERFNTPAVKIIANDFLFSNTTCLRAFLGVTQYSARRISEQIRHLNNLPSGGENYFSRHFGGRYFSHDNARKIGAMREEITHLAANEAEKAILLCALLYATDKVANTVGHYDAFRKKMDTLQEVKLLMPDIRHACNANNTIHQQDANTLVQQMRCDVLYIDPPYNSRQYCDAYHLLENVAEWKKPKVSGIGRKMDRAHIKSDYCVSKAAQAFADLVRHADCRHILLSYNNTGDSKDGRSNARIRDEQILDILNDKGSVETFERSYKAFTTGRSSSAHHTERVFYCRVRT